MDRAAALIQRVALGGTRLQMARIARLGLQWPIGQGRYMDKLRMSVGRCALDRLGSSCGQDLVRCGVVDEDYVRNTQWDGFDPLCALLMQPVCPDRVMLALNTTDPGKGQERGRRLGEVGVRAIQAASRLLAEYGDGTDEAREAWLAVVDRLLAMGMGRDVRLSYAPVGLLAACSDARIAQGLLDRGFDANGPEGLLPPIALCQEASVVRVLMAGGASCLVPSMNFIDDPVARLGYIEREDTRIFARWCRTDTAMAREILAASNMMRARNHEVEDAILSIHDNNPGGGDEVADIFALLCRDVGMDRMEAIMGGEDGMHRRSIMLNSGMAQGYRLARAEADRTDMTARTGQQASTETGAIARL